jgi:oligopeptidase A
VFQQFLINNFDEFPKELKKLIDSNLKDIDDLVLSQSNNYDDIMRVMDDNEEKLELFFTPLSHLNSVENSEETQKAYEQSLPLLSEYSNKIAQNKKLYEKILTINGETLEQNKVLEDSIRGFKLRGIDLPIVKQKRLEEIDLRLSELSNHFSQNLLNEIKSYELIIEDENDVKNLPSSDKELALCEIDGKKVYRFTLQHPSYIAYMTYGVNRAYREELYRAFTSKAPQNSEIIDEILKLKMEEANILGFENFASYSLATKDAPDEKSVIDFLDELAKLSLPQASKDIQELQELALRVDGLEKLEPYDVGYYSNILQFEKFDFDDSMTKPYFQSEQVLNGLLQTVENFFGVEFKDVSLEVEHLWNDKVKVFDVYEDNLLHSRLYFDLEARASKRGGAWMHNFETHYIKSNGDMQKASAFIVCNFSPSTATQPSLLSHSDVVTLFHEMGHAIHHIFTKCVERDVSGINGVAWDTVEFPSQFLENFAYEKSILKSFAKHYESGEPISDELLDKIDASKNFQASLGMLRQMEFSLFDFKLHQKLYGGDEVQRLLDSIRETTALIKVPEYNKFQNGFSHIFAGGYSAGYYSYKWAEVLSADAFFECVDEHGVFNYEKLLGYKEHILAKGGSDSMRNLYKNWLDKEPEVPALLKLYGIL